MYRESFRHFATRWITSLFLIASLFTSALDKPPEYSRATSRMDIAWCTCIPGSSLHYVLRSQHDIEEPESNSINRSEMEEDGNHEQEIEENVKVEEDEIVHGETNKRPLSGSANERNTVEGEKDHPANGPTKMSSDKLGRSRKAKDKGAAAVGVNSAGGATYVLYSLRKQQIKKMGW